MKQKLSFVSKNIKNRYLNGVHHEAVYKRAFMASKRPRSESGQNIIELACFRLVIAIISLAIVTIVSKFGYFKGGFWEKPFLEKVMAMSLGIYSIIMVLVYVLDAIVRMFKFVLSIFFGKRNTNSESK
jgi:uncharacterized membrane protein